MAQAVERAKQVTVNELNSIIGVSVDCFACLVVVVSNAWERGGENCEMTLCSYVCGEQVWWEDLVSVCSN